MFYEGNLLVTAMLWTPCALWSIFVMCTLSTSYVMDSRGRIMFYISRVDELCFTSLTYILCLWTSLLVIIFTDPSLVIMNYEWTPNGQSKI